MRRRLLLLSLTAVCLVACLAGCLVGGALALDRLFPPELNRLAQVGTEIDDRHGATLAVLPAPGGVWRLRTTVADVPPGFLDLLVTVEDRRFWSHPGVDALALARASFQMLRAGHVVSGGSTLTMQVVRLLHPRRRTVWAKAIEALRALQLEAHYDKRTILGMWLTLAPFGGNLEGVRAASLAWFGKPPQALDATEQALLVAIPRRPEGMRPDRHPDRARLVRARVIARGLSAGVLTPGDLDPAPGSAHEDVPQGRHAMPRHAAQLWARRDLPAGVTASTLDLPLQMALERLTQARIAAMPPHVSMAVVIGDLHDRTWRAISPGWSGGPGSDGSGEALSRGGALDLTRALRSPGSTLKPFIYAMAFEDGLIAPDTPVPDLPRRFGHYAPENFDRSFAGTLTAAEALRRSLNLPAVALLDAVGPLRFRERMRAAGVMLRLPPGASATLPLALGGAGTTLRDLVALYAGLATDGQVAPLRLWPDQPMQRRRLVEPRAARTIAGVLTWPLPEFGPRGIAWKTGTSWGGRDAWAIGFDAAHVVGVWIGRPDGTAMPEATGRGLAVPMLAQVFDLLPPAPRPMPAAHPATTAGSVRMAASDSLRLLFPPPDAIVSNDGPVPLRVVGGRRPMTFLIDGRPIPTEPVERQTTWLPSGPGFYRLTVLDADGTAVGASVRVR